VTTLTRAKIALALIGIFLFGAGMRLERAELRWTGLGFVLVAWLLRFAGRRRPEDSNSGSD
jgi:hypothetical protein